MIGRGEIECRHDPYYYLPEFIYYERNYTKFPTEMLFRLSKKVVSGPFGSTIKSSCYRKDGIPFIRIKDVRNSEISFKDIVFISHEDNRRILNSELKPGDIVLSKIGTIGEVAMMPLNYPTYNISENNIGISIRTDIDILKDYVLYALQSIYVKQQIKRNLSGNVQKFLNLSTVRKLRIVVPPKEIQESIITVYENGLRLKKKKEHDANDLIRSIDTYVLSQLGIRLPEPTENTLAERTFITPFQLVTGSRIDPKKYSRFYQRLFSSIESCPLDKVELRTLITHSASGDWGLDASEVTSPSDYTECIVIRATEFDNQYNLNLSNDRMKLRSINNRKLGRMDIRKGDLLIEKSGGSDDQPVGRIAIIEAEVLEAGNIAYSNFVHKIRVRSDVDSRYIFQFLKTMHNIKLTDAMQSQTNGIRNLIMSEYLHQLIPIPLKSKQEEIAEHVAALRVRAKSLQSEAVQVLEEAKVKVERMILGEDV